jgi:hypothetical protein
MLCIVGTGMCGDKESEWDCTRVSQKVTDFSKKHIYYKYIETKLFFNVLSLDFNAPIPATHRFF